MQVIKVTSLSKNFGETQALRNFSLTVEGGQVLGLLGPNGAGKTTLIKTLVGGVRPVSGEVEVLGKNPLKNRKELAQKFGYMPQEACLYEDLSVKENIRFFGKLHVRENLDEEIDSLLEFLDMSAKKNERVQHLSGGMKTRVSLACALIHKPDILFLDEPTAGLDPSLKRSLWDLFRKLSHEGKTLFISTHLMDEALLCDTLAIVKEGELVVHDTPANIVAKGKVTVELEVAGQRKVADELPADPKAIAVYLRKYGLNENVQRLSIQPESLEDITIKLVDNKPL